jgi:putative ABC transport system substrate-binding protein
MLTALLLTACGPSKPETYTIGVVNFSPGLDLVFDGFKVGMDKAGYVEGEGVTYLYEGAVGTIGALDPAIEKLIAEDVDLILSITTPATQKVKEAVEGTDTHAVFAPVTDPVESGIVESITRPRGNLTGIASGGSIAKGLAWLLQIAPDTERLFVPHNPDDNSSVQSLKELSEAADKIDLDLAVVEVRNSEEFEAAMDAIPEDVQAIFMLPSGFMSARTALFVETSIAHKLPTCSVAPKYEEGVLMSYGHNYVRMGEQAARLADQILQGTDPANLPVEAPEFYLGINLQTAQAIGLDIPDDILAQADDIVR